MNSGFGLNQFIEEQITISLGEPFVNIGGNTPLTLNY